MDLTHIFNAPKLKPKKIKYFQYFLIACCALLPWNATAVNQGSLTEKIFTKKLGRDLIESLLVKSLLEITQGNTKQAMTTVNELIRTAPNFKLAYLIRGDLISSQGAALEGFGKPSATGNDKTGNDEVEGLREEARTRIEHYFSEDKNHLVPNLLVELDANQQHLIVVDTVKSRLFLYKKSDAGLQYVADYYVTIGKNGADKQAQGDKRTPLGLYFASKKMAGPLEDFYGDGAYPLNYPNELDQHQSKTGSGIWLHGTPHDTYSRPPRASDGCVVLSNPDLNTLKPILDAGNTPVVISNKIDWVENQSTSQNTQKTLAKAMLDWRADWVGQNTEAYLNHYSKSFFYSDGGFAAWADHKRSVQASKPKVAINIGEISMFSYPSAKLPTVVVNFTQDFRSQTLQNKMRKRQYWQQEGNEWKIIYEGAV